LSKINAHESLRDSGVAMGASKQGRRVPRSASSWRPSASTKPPRRRTLAPPNLVEGFVDYFNGDPAVHTWTYKVDKAA
jgi:hypothetical protein